jgi:hypothetical protein
MPRRDRRLLFASPLRSIVSSTVAVMALHPTMTLMTCLAFRGPQRLSQATALDVVPPQGSKDDLWGRSDIGRRLVVWRGVNVMHGSHDGVSCWVPLRYQDL